MWHHPPPSGGPPTGCSFFLAPLRPPIEAPWRQLKSGSTHSYVTRGEDASAITEGDAAKNLSRVRRLALAPLKRGPETLSKYQNKKLEGHWCEVGSWYLSSMVRKGVRGRAVLGLCVAAAFGGAAGNAINGIDEASVSEGRAGEGGTSAGAGGAGCAGGAPWGSGGAGGVSGAGGGGGAGSGGAAASRLDASFGKGGELTFEPGGLGARGYRVSALIVQPSGKAVLAGEARFEIEDFSNTGRRNAFLARFEGGKLDATFGAGGLSYFRDAVSPLQRYDDKVRAVSFDAATNTMFALIDQWRINSEDYDSYGEALYRSSGDGLVALQGGFEGDLERGFGVISSSQGCVAARTYEERLPEDPSKVTDSGLEFAACSLDWSFVFDKRVSFFGQGLTFLPLVGELSPEFVAPLATASGHVFFPIKGPEGAVGVVKLRHEGGSNVALEPTFGAGSGRALQRPDAFDASQTRLVDAMALDDEGGVYLAGRTQTSGPTLPFLVKFGRDGAGLDASFGVGGALPGMGADGERWSCLSSEGGALLAVGTRQGQSVVMRFTAAGQPDESFEAGGLLALPLAPQRCAFDRPSRLLVAGTRPGLVGEAALSIVALRTEGPPGGPIIAGGAEPGACATADADEPNGESALATPMRGRKGESPIDGNPADQAMWNSILDGPGDVDWFRYQGYNYNSGPSAIDPAARVDFIGPLEICLFTPLIDGIGCFSGTRDEVTLPGQLGCCANNSVSMIYSEPTTTEPISRADFLVRVSKRQSQPGACEAYRVVATF